MQRLSWKAYHKITIDNHLVNTFHVFTLFFMIQPYKVNIYMKGGKKIKR